MPADIPDRSASKQFETRAEDYDAQGLLRKRRALQPQPAPRVEYAGRSYINFCSNDYLGLAGDARIAETFRRALDH